MSEAGGTTARCGRPVRSSRSCRPSLPKSSPKPSSRLTNEMVRRQVEWSGSICRRSCLRQLAGPIRHKEAPMRRAMPRERSLLHSYSSWSEMRQRSMSPANRHQWRTLYANGVPARGGFSVPLLLYCGGELGDRSQKCRSHHLRRQCMVSLQLHVNPIQSVRYPYKSARRRSSRCRQPTQGPVSSTHHCMGWFH